MDSRKCLAAAAILGFMAVFLGAFGAHGLKDSGFLTRKYGETEAKDYAGMSIPASYKYLLDFETGVRYHMWHALAMGLTGVLMRWHPSKALSAAAWCFALGITLFSGSLYILVAGGPKFLGVPWGMIAPAGGTLLLVGWLALARGAWQVPGAGRS